MGVPLHPSLNKWELDLGYHLDLKRLWKGVWLPYWAMAEAHFLWQIAYHIPATHHWRFLDLPPEHPTTWCDRCRGQEHEDILHCIWLCPESMGIWNWVANLLEHAASHEEPIVLQANEALLGMLLRMGLSSMPVMLWELLKGITCWKIWKSWCSWCREACWLTQQAVANLIWHRLRQYLHIEWHKLTVKCLIGQMEWSQVQTRFIKEFGVDARLYKGGFT